MITLSVLLAGLAIFFAISIRNQITGWRFDGQQWRRPVQGIPSCPDPLLTQSPVDLNRATSILYPGQYRGTDYKGHGGFHFSTSKNSEISVKLPMEARLTEASRYTINGDVQYLLTFINDCGLAVRFDHLLTLSPTFESIVGKLPLHGESDSRGVAVVNRPLFPAGTLVATAVGVPSLNNVGVDFGLYDLRQPNKISQNPKWLEIHKDELELNAYGICWFDLLPADDRQLMAAFERSYLKDYGRDRAVSDYCPAAGGTTLDYNDGLPTEAETD